MPLSHLFLVILVASVFSFLGTSCASLRPNAGAKPIITASAFSTWPQRLIWLALALLLIESFLFHRKAVY